MKNLWFTEDREKYKGDELKEALAESEKALRNSTLLRRRLLKILEDKLEKAYQIDEDFHQANYHVAIAQSAGRRKVLRELIELLDFDKKG